MDYKDLKNGSIIVLTNCDNMIVIVDKVEKDTFNRLKLYTYVKLEDNDIFFEKEEPGYSYILENIQFRPATEEDKYTLYNAIGKYFTEEYDKDWYNHFTDSSWFDIQLYIWKILCKSNGYEDEHNDEFGVELVDKKEFINKVCNYLENINTDDYMDSGIFQMYDLIKDLRKVMEE